MLDKYSENYNNLIDRCASAEIQKDELKTELESKKLKLAELRK